MTEEWPCPVHDCETTWPSMGSLRGHVTGKSDGEHVWAEVKGSVHPRISGGEAAPESEDSEGPTQGDSSGGGDPPATRPDSEGEPHESEPGSYEKPTADEEVPSESNSSKSEMVDPTEYEQQQQPSGGSTPTESDGSTGTGQGDDSGGGDTPADPKFDPSEPPKGRPVNGGGVPGLDELADVSMTTILLGVAVLVVVVWLLTRNPSGEGGESIEQRAPVGASEDGEEQSDEGANAFKYYE